MQDEFLFKYKLIWDDIDFCGLSSASNISKELRS